MLSIISLTEVNIIHNYKHRDSNVIYSHAHYIVIDNTVDQLRHEINNVRDAIRRQGLL